MDRLAEASKIIQKTTNLRVLELVSRFHLYPEDSREILEGRWMVLLNAFLLGLKIGPTHFEGMTKGQKVEEILRQIQPSRSAEMFEVSEIDMETWDNRSLATQIDNTSYSLFKTIPFEAWVAVAIGRYPESLKQFSEGHSQLRDQISGALLNTPERCTQYQTLLGTLRCPFAKLALRSAINQRTYSIEYAARFIIGPLRGLFEDKTTSLQDILLRLDVLAQRYKRLYICDNITKVDWNRFRMDLAFSEVLGGESYRQIANSIGSERIMAPKATLEECVYEVVEFVHADSAYSSKFGKIALCLHQLGNPNSSMPILKGLELAGIDGPACFDLYRLTEFMSCKEMDIKCFKYVQGVGNVLQLPFVGAQPSPTQDPSLM
ncbi:MAG: hypothetical protein M1840_000621 [Geoglossum simile]|nr:MAG: hypothetical protein M1840_000621 [Geoglossum simile]